MMQALDSHNPMVPEWLAPTVPGRLAEWSQRKPQDVAYSFVDYRKAPAGDVSSLTWSELDRQVQDLSAVIQQRTPERTRVLLLLPTSLWYVVAFCACLRAGRIAVPLYPPHPSGRDDRLTSVVEDCDAGSVICLSDAVPTVRSLCSEIPAEAVIAADDVPAPLPGDHRPWPITPQDVAHLQYTSGSTSQPRGVVMTHGNIAANMYQVEQHLTGGDPARQPASYVSWLPLFHDMGLSLGIFIGVLHGRPTVLMDPADFLMRPSRWLQLLAAADRPASAAPNFAFDYCARRVRPDHLRAEVRLDHVAWIINGAEPVRAAAVTSFNDRFARHGLRADVVSPSYGLAESTVFVTGTAGLTEIALRADDLETGRATPVPLGESRSRRLVSCGRPAEGAMVAIVDPKTRRRVGPDATGEVWVSGWAVAQGYWGRSTQPDEVFGARLVDDDVPGRTWLRTGDVGVLSGADLYITGRLKDVLVINGKNHHAEDIEATVKAVDQRIGNGRVAVFGYPAAEDKEKAVVLFSARDISAADNPELISAVRTKIGQEHGVPLHDVRIVRSGTLPVTSSGKIRRRRARELYEQGHWAASTGPEEYAGTRSR